MAIPKLTKREKRLLAVIVALIATCGGVYLFSTNNSRHANAIHHSASSAGDDSVHQPVQRNLGINAHGGGNVQGDGATIEQPVFKGNGNVYKPTAPVTINNGTSWLREPDKDSPFRNYIIYMKLHPEEMTPKPIDVFLASDFANAAQKAQAELAKGNRKSAVYYADAAFEALEETRYYSLQLGAPLSEDLKQLITLNGDIRVQSAWDVGDFANMRKRLQNLHEMTGIGTNPLFMAYGSVADSRRYDDPFMPPSEYDLLFAAKTGSGGRIFEYLNLLARWGYLLPNRYDPSLNKMVFVDYAKILGVESKIEFAPQYQYTITRLDNGLSAQSHKYIAQRRGFDASEVRDLTRYEARFSGSHIIYEPSLDFGSNPPLLSEDQSCRLNWMVPPNIAPDKKIGDIVPVECSLAIYDGHGWATAWSTRQSVPVPEPTSTLLIILGIAGMALRRKVR